MSAFDIVGFTTTDFVPGFVAQVTLAAGKLSAGSVPIKVMLVGNKTSAGSMVANQDVVQVYSEDQADSLVGPGSEIGRMAYAALKAPGSPSVYLAPVTDPGGTAATLTITYATTATSDGTYKYWIGGRQVQVGVSSGDTPTAVALKAVAAIGANTKLGCTAAPSSGVVTLTWKQTGPRGNDIIVRQDTTLGPTGMTSTLGGAGSVVAGLGQKFGGGATTDDLTTVATNTFPQQYHRVALAARDSTQLGVWKASMVSKAGPFEQRPQHTVCAVNSSLSAAQSLSQTTLNDGRTELMWMLNGESDPAEMAAYFAALRSVTEQGDPGAAYDGQALTGIAPHTRDVDSPQRSTQLTALQTGVTPIKTVNGVPQVSRAITTRCLNGTNPDYRVLDVGTSYVPDFIRLDIGLLWDTDYRISNPLVADDQAPELGDRPSGYATPTRWNQYVYARLKAHESGTTVSSGRPQVQDVENNLPASVFDKDAKRIMSAIPVIPSYRQHQIGVTILQL